MEKIMLILAASVVFLIASAVAIAVAGMQDRRAERVRKHSTNRNYERLEEAS